MIIPDANLLIYAHDSSCPQHSEAKTWWEAALSGKEPVGIPWVVVLAFTRIMTHPQICTAPLDSETVRGMVDQWLDCPQVRIIQISERAVSVFFDLLNEAGMGGNLSTDALIAAHAREHSATIYSNDRDFDRLRSTRGHSVILAVQKESNATIDKLRSRNIKIPLSSSPCAPAIPLSGKAGGSNPHSTRLDDL